MEARINQSLVPPLTHLNVRHAMVDGHQRLVPELSERAGTHGHATQRCTHAGPLGERDGVNVAGNNVRLAQRLANELDNPLLVMLGAEKDVVGEQSKKKLLNQRIN